MGLKHSETHLNNKTYENYLGFAHHFLQKHLVCPPSPSPLTSIYLAYVCKYFTVKLIRFKSSHASYSSNQQITRIIYIFQLVGNWIQISPKWSTILHKGFYFHLAISLTASNYWVTNFMYTRYVFITTCQLSLKKNDELFLSYCHISAGLCLEHFQIGLHSPSAPACHNHLFQIVWLCTLIKYGYLYFCLFSNCSYLVSFAYAMFVFDTLVYAYTVCQ